jgi:hypothetical protein
MKAWLDLEDVDLLTTSVLALGNFARTDDHCTRMVQENMHVKLIEILAKNNAPEDDVRLQHALVSKLLIVSQTFINIILIAAQRHQKSSHPEAEQSCCD